MNRTCSYSILVMDNDHFQTRALENALEHSIIKDCYSVVAVNTCDGFKEQIASNIPSSFDIVFMDIDLGPRCPTGIQLIKDNFSHKSKTQVVYLTGHVEFVPEVFETPHAFILAKPFSQENVDKALKRAIDLLQIQPANDTYLAAITNGSIRKISYSTILWVESNQHNVLLHTDSETIEIKGPLCEIASRLPPHFFQIHRKHIVNLDHVVQIGKDVILDTGHALSVSRTLKTKAKSALFDHVEKTWILE